MSLLIARQALERLNLRESLFAPTYLAGLMADMRQLASADAAVEQDRAVAARVETLSAYGFSADPESVKRKPFAFHSGIAIIPIHGSLINRFGASWGFVTGYNFIRSQLNAALADDDVIGIVFDVNSNGGECAGCFELADDIFAARGKKPMLAVVDSACYSAAYATASAADRVVVTPTGGAGSIGVVAMHVSMEKMLSDAGYEINFIYAGKHKVDGNPYQDLSESVRADIQRGVDLSYEKFVLTVARNRQLDAKAVRDTEAQCYRAEDALELGLIDAVQSPAQAVSAFFNELSGSTTEEEPMPTEKDDQANAATAPVTEQASAADVKKAERERVSGILNCEEAANNAALANHLALSTELSVEEARGILGASKPAEPAAAAPVAPAANHFQAAMDADKHPGLSNDESGGGGEGEKSKADLILGAHSVASGRKYN